MAGNLKTCALIAGITAQLTRADTGFTTATRKLTKQLLATDVTAFNSVFAAEYSIAAAGTQTVDFFAAFTDLLGNSVSLTKAIALLVLATGSGVIVEPKPATNPLVWFYSGTSPQITIHAGGGFLFFDGATRTIDATHRNILFTETGGATLTLDVVLWGGT